MLMLIRDDEQWEAYSDAERNMEGIGGWFMNLAAEGRLRGGEQLHPSRTATTVSWQGGAPVVTDGPFMETKETIAGFGIIDVPDLDTALGIARTWPAPGHRIEVRPCVEHPGG
jgi:hypothetical protein